MTCNGGIDGIDDIVCLRRMLRLYVKERLIDEPFCLKPPQGMYVR